MVSLLTQSLKAPQGLGTGLDALPSSFGFTTEGLGGVTTGNTAKGVGVMMAEFRSNIHAAEGPKRNLSGSVVRVNVYADGGVGNQHHGRRLTGEKDGEMMRRSLQQDPTPTSAYFTVTKVVHKEVSHVMSLVLAPSLPHIPLLLPHALLVVDEIQVFVNNNTTPLV